MISLTKVLIGSDDIHGIVEVLKSGNLAQGEKVLELERKFAKLCGVKYAVAVNSGTAALHCALYACGIKKGDEVITTPFTFVATANSIAMLGAVPVFVDIKKKTYNLNPDLIEKHISNKTKAILAVNLFGQPADFELINSIAKKHKLIVIEDAAQSINGKYNQKKSGSLGDIGCFSLYATKNLMSGEGGMLTTNSTTFYKMAKLFRNHGQAENNQYEYFDIGYNYRMTNLTASLAITQLKQLKQNDMRRQRTANSYNKAFRKIPNVTLNMPDDNRTHSYHQYVLQIGKKAKMGRDQLKEYLEKKGIQSKIYYPTPLYKFRHLQIKKSHSLDFPITNVLCKEILAIPVHPYLKKVEIRYIINTVLNAYEIGKKAL